MTIGFRIALRFAAFGSCALVALGGCGGASDQGAEQQTQSSFTPEAGGADAAGELANAFSREGYSLPSYTLIEWTTSDIPAEFASKGARSGATLTFDGATAMDSLAFQKLVASFVVFESTPDARAFYEGYQASASSFSEIAVEDFEISGDGVPASAAQCIADRSFTGGMTCLILEEDLNIVSLILYANGPAVESAYGQLTVEGISMGEERWLIRSFEDDGFYNAVTPLNQAFHRYVNQTLDY